MNTFFRKTLKKWSIALVPILWVQLGFGQSMVFNSEDEAIKSNLFPHQTIRKKDLSITVFLPDSSKGFYRSSRFDWSGMIGKIKFKNHTYTQLKRPPHNPLDPVAVLSLCESFAQGLGFDSAQLGDKFVKIGVGVLQKNHLKAENLEFQPIVDGGKRFFSMTKNSMTFVHKITSDFGFAYEYTKKIEINDKGDGLIIHHELKNTGKKTIKEKHYSHNYFNMNHQTIGPNYTAKFDFPVSMVPKKGVEEFYKEDGNTLLLQREFNNKNEDWVYFGVLLKGFTKSEYLIHLENKSSKSGVEIRGNSPITKLYYWSDNYNTCPIVFVDIQIEPGEKQSWNNYYKFYETK